MFNYLRLSRFLKAWPKLLLLLLLLLHPWFLSSASPDLTPERSAGCHVSIRSISRAPAFQTKQVIFSILSVTREPQWLRYRMVT